MYILLKNFCKMKLYLKHKQHLTILRIQSLGISLIFNNMAKSFDKYCFNISHDNIKFFNDTENFLMTIL